MLGSLSSQAAMWPWQLFHHPGGSAHCLHCAHCTQSTVVLHIEKRHSWIYGTLQRDKILIFDTILGWRAMATWKSKRVFPKSKMAISSVPHLVWNKNNPFSSIHNISLLESCDKIRNILDPRIPTEFTWESSHGGSIHWSFFRRTRLFSGCIFICPSTHSIQSNVWSLLKIDLIQYLAPLSTPTTFGTKNGERGTWWEWGVRTPFYTTGWLWSWSWWWSWCW